MDIQKLLDTISAQAQNERAAVQMTLGELITNLEMLSPNLNVKGLSAECDSYRGYYSDLAFEPGESTVGDLLKVAKDALNKEFTGYKGGEFVMRKNTPVWCASYGCCGLAVMGIESKNGEMHFNLKEEE